jgi:hypothetical protein
MSLGSITALCTSVDDLIQSLRANAGADVVTGRDVTIGSVYMTLDLPEAKELVVSTRTAAGQKAPDSAECLRVRSEPKHSSKSGRCASGSGTA